MLSVTYVGHTILIRGRFWSLRVEGRSTDQSRPALRIWLPVLRPGESLTFRRGLHQRVYLADTGRIPSPLAFSRFLPGSILELRICGQLVRLRAKDRRSLLIDAPDSIRVRVLDQPKTRPERVA